MLEPFKRGDRASQGTGTNHDTGVGLGRDSKEWELISSVLVSDSPSAGMIPRLVYRQRMGCHAFNQLEPQQARKQ